ncbi:MAG: hypothetical protein K2H04_04945 [Bacteroidaceae bacterium]|nr:hypothetical protein [Bacteroidaceae bacterium]
MDYTDIQTKLKQHNLADTFPLLRKKVTEIGDWELAEQTETIWATYQQMLQFLLQGVTDAQGERIRTNICHTLSFIAHRLERLERIKQHPEEKYAYVAKEMRRLDSFETIVTQFELSANEVREIQHDKLLRDTVRQHRMEELTELHERQVVQLFNWIWTSEIWQNTDTEQANRLLFSDTISSYDKAIFISAVTLSLLEFADVAKLLFLLDGYLVEDDQISQRSIVGFVLAFHVHYDQFKDQQELIDRLNIYHDDTSFIHDLYAVMMQLQMSCVTESVTSKMRNDIMPTLMRGVMAKKKTDSGTDTPSTDPNTFVEHGENPEWMDDERMNKKMREMAEMQVEGADVYYATFSMMKGFPFFNQMPHWFYPFSLSEHSVVGLKSFTNRHVNKFFRMLLNGSPFCNSDKYSLCFSLSSFGSMTESAIEAQINSQIPKGMNLDELAESEEMQKPKRADVRRHYVFDLYRFYHNYPYKQQFTNLFALLKKHPLTPFSHPLLQKLLAETPEEMEQYADFLMRKEFYQAALDIFQALATNEFDASLASIWQKIGFCHQKLQHTEETIHAYTVANNIKPHSKWTLRHLATLCSSTGRMEEAVLYYQQLVAIQPENQKYLIGTAQSLMQCERYEEALPLLHKAFYLDEQSQQVKLLLAWSLIVNGQKDDAIKFIFDLQQADAMNEEANLLLGIVMLLDGRTKEAYSQLRPLCTADNCANLRRKLDTLCRHHHLDSTATTLLMDALILRID